MVDKTENILVEFDYNNITIIDPNKVIDSNNKVKDRYVKQEDLVLPWFAGHLDAYNTH